MSPDRLTGRQVVETQVGPLGRDDRVAGDPQSVGPEGLELGAPDLGPGRHVKGSDRTIVESGDHTLALHLEDHGYADFLNHDLDGAQGERPLTGASS